MKNREVRKQRKAREKARELVDDGRILPTAAEWSAEDDRAEELVDLGWAYMNASAIRDQGIE